MRKFLAGLLGMVLCVQTVYGIPAVSYTHLDVYKRQIMQNLSEIVK